MEGLTLERVQELCGDSSFRNGRKYFRRGAVQNPWFTASALHGDVQGSGRTPYRVEVRRKEDGTLVPRCTCPAHRRIPFCKHVAALLVAWVEQPSAFVHAPEIEKRQPESTVRRTRTKKASRAELVAQGLDKTEALLADLATGGLLTLTPEKVAAMQALADMIAAHKLRRLSRRLTELHLLLATQLQSPKALDVKRYAEGLCDAWLTLAATRSALADPSANQWELEELVGKTWREKDLERREGLDLMELAYHVGEVATGFRIESSYLLDLASGHIYVERQITPVHLRKATPKPARAHLLAGCTVGIYPGRVPRRVKILAVGEERPITQTDREQAMRYAARTWDPLVRALREATLDPLAPEAWPCLFAPSRIHWEPGTIWLVDNAGRGVGVSDVGGQAILRQAAMYGQEIAVFGMLVFAGEKLTFQCMGVVD